MGDPFGTTTGIAGIISLVIQITKEVVQFGLDWKDAPENVKTFMAELGTLKTVLSETNTNIIFNPDFAEVFQGQHSLLLKQLGSHAPPTTDAKSMLQVCQRGLDSLLKELKKRGQDHRLGWERLKGAFLAKDTRDSVENLCRQCQTLNNMLSIDTAVIGVTTFKEIKDVRREQQEWRQEDTKISSAIKRDVDQSIRWQNNRDFQTILDWLTPIDYATQQSDFINRRQAGTGQWLLDSTEFQTWLNTNKETLFCPGIPGAGKTILTSIVIEELNSRFFEDSTIGIAYIYCNFRRKDEQKINDLLASLLKQLAMCLPSIPSSKPKLQEEIKAEIANCVEGMFLLAQLYLSSLEDKTTVKAIRSALKQFQKQIQKSNEDKKLEILSLAYEQTMEKINGQQEGFQLLAKKVLSWITCANRPLKTIELQHAIAVEENHLELDEDNLPEIEDMVSVCAGLVTIDEDNNIIRLVHYTTQEYFERTQSYWFPDAEADITKTCITYLSFNVFESGFCQTDDEFEKRLQSNQFFEYASQNWGHHAGKTSTLSEASSQAIINFLESEAKVNASSQGLLAIKIYIVDSNYSQRVPWMTGLHLTVLFGTVAVVKLLLEKGKVDVDSKDAYGETPLSYASGQGHEAVVKFLLEIDKVNVNSKDIYGQMPLLYAVKNGHEAVVKLLLKTGKVNVNSKDTYGQTPLLYATKNGHEAIVKLLLKTGKVDVNSKDTYGQTPLLYAAGEGNKAIVKLLLKTGKVNVNSKDAYGQTPLSYTARKGNEAIVKLLLETSKVDVNPKDIYGQMPLLYAAKNGHEAVVKLLLKTGKVDVNSKDIYGQTPLLYAAKNGHEAVVKLLLEKGVEAGIENRSGWTALQLAAFNKHEGVEQLFVVHRPSELEDFYGLQHLFLIE
ncbi:hypothetical protein B7463_g4512, partial [Scytalidium lignicola]